MVEFNIYRNASEKPVQLTNDEKPVGYPRRRHTPRLGSRRVGSSAS